MRALMSIASTVSIVLIGLLVACSDSKREPPAASPPASPPAEPPKPAVLVPPVQTEVSPEDAERFAKLADQIAGAVATYQRDCAAMARAIHSVLDANRETLKAGAEARATRRQLPAPVLGRIQDRLQAMANDLLGCVNDPAVQDAFARYRGKPTSRPEIPAADAAKIVALVDEVAAAVARTKADCAKLAAAINRVIDANQPVLALASSAQAAGKQLPPATLQQLIDKLQAIAPQLRTCTGNRAVELAFGRLQLTGT